MYFHPYINILCVCVKLHNFPSAESTDIKIHNVRAMSLSFIAGLIKDYSPRYSLSDGSEELFQRGKGESQYICDFGKGGRHAIKCIFLVESFCWSHEASASHEKQFSPQRRILVLF